MQSTSDAYQEAAAAGAQTPVYEVLVDWDRDGSAPGDPLDDVTVYVDSITVDASLTTDLPEETRLVTGYTSTEVTVELTGDPLDNALDGARLWSPYNSASPYYGKVRMGAPVSIRLGYQTSGGPELLPQITGRVRDLTVRGGSRAATLEALDGAESLRQSVTLPLGVGLDPGVQQGGLNSQWPIDYILRQGGHRSIPPESPSCALYVSCHGSMLPDVGDLAGCVLSGPGVTASDVLPYAHGMFALAPAPTPGMQYTTTYTVVGGMLPNSGQHMVWKGWVQVPSTADLALGTEMTWRTVDVDASPDGYAAAVIDSSSGSAVLRADVSITGNPVVSLPGVTLTAGWHYIGVHVAFGSATATATYRVDGVTATTATTAIPSVFVFAGWTGGEISGRVPVEAVQFTTESNPQWDDTFVSGVELEPGLNELTAIPTTSASDAWALLQEIVAAEQGTIWMRGDGAPVFWNRRHWRESTGANTVVKTLTTTSSILDLSTVEVSDGIRNHIQVPYRPLTILGAGLIWQATGDPVSVPARGSVTMIADLGSDMAYGVDTTGGIIPSGGPTAASGSGYRAARNVDGSGGSVANLTMTVEALTASRFLITFRNPNSFVVWLVSPSGAGFPSTSDGQPSVALVGRLITAKSVSLDTGTLDDTTPTTALAEAVLPGLDPADERLYTAPDSPWRQCLSCAQDMADDLLRALHRPVPQIHDLSIVADFALERGDRVKLQDPDGLGLDDPFWVVGVRTEVSASGATQTLTLRPVAAAGQFIFGVTGRDLLSVTPL